MLTRRDFSAIPPRLVLPLLSLGRLTNALNRKPPVSINRVGLPVGVICCATKYSVRRLVVMDAIRKR